MKPVVAVIPSRGRPERARRALRALRDRAALVSTELVLVVDADDPELENYRAIRFPDVPFRPQPRLVILEGPETGNLVRATNTVSLRIARENPDAIIGNLGDDHVARTDGWDRRIAEELERPGIAYGDDAFQGEKLPTAPFISARIVLALGWYALPSCRHLFVDNAWRDLGEMSGTLRYLPDVVIEHRHPLAGKAKWDPGYEKANGPETVEHDKTAYYQWRAALMGRDVETVRRVAA